ncbi:MAG: DNA polymerase I [Pseudomonadota bacterium]
MKNITSPLILVDGSSYLFRAYHAMPNLTNPEGHPTGAIYGVINMLKRLIADYQPDFMGVIFDAKGKTFRHERYTDYKANRPPMPDDLREQIAPLHQMIAALGLPIYAIEGVEADDVIGTLARQANEQGIETVISTGDKDLAQLVTEHVTLIDTMKNAKLDVPGIKEKFGVPPEHIIDFLALMGDSVDNIPGVPGVGNKTALALLENYPGIEAIYENLESVPQLTIRGAKSLAKKLQDNREMAYLSRELATIKTDVTLDFTLEQLKISKPDSDALLALYDEFGFRTWLNQLNKNTAEEEKPQPQKGEYHTVFTQAEFDELLKKIRNADLVAFDTETTSLNYMDAELVGISVSYEPAKAYYIPLAHDYEGAPTQLDRDSVLSAFKPLLEDASQRKFVGQNLKYDMHILQNYGITMQAIRDDTMLASYVYNSVANRHDMDTLAAKHLNHTTIHFEDIAGKGKKQLTFNQIALEDAAPYAAEDADVTLQLQQVLINKLEETSSTLSSVYRDIELQVMPVLMRMEHHGVAIDRERLDTQSQEIAVKLEQLQQDAFELAGSEFNLGSPKQLQSVLYDDLALPIIKKTPKGQPSTAEDVLQELAETYDLPKKILEYRSLSKLKSTYTDKLPEQINSRTGRVHTSYHQAVAATGRLSSSDPNLQNIPIKTAEGRRIRQAFIAPEGYKIVAADYSQIELRIMAHLSKDASLLDAFSQNRDIHRATASEIFGVTEDEVDAEQRRRAKAVNFGLIYGMSAFGLAKQLHVARDEAQHYIHTYFARYPGVETYMENTRQQAKEKGYVETLVGRRLYLPEIKASNAMRRKAAERTAINAPMQGTAADIIKLAMIQVDKWLTENMPETKMIMQVHDELVFEVPEKHFETFKPAIRDIMVSALPLDVPLLVDIGDGLHWDDAH